MGPSDNHEITQPPDDCRELAVSAAILDRLADELAAVGLVGDVIPTAKLLYLAVVSRLLPRPVSVVVKAPSVPVNRGL